MSNSNIRSFAGLLSVKFLPVKMFFSKRQLTNHSAHAVQVYTGCRTKKNIAATVADLLGAMRSNGSISASAVS